jgi:DNA ligase-1
MTPFTETAKLAEELSHEPGRLKKRAAIAAALRVTQAAGGSEDAGLFCLYLAGQPFAEADPRKLNAGGALLTKAVKEVSGCTDAALTAAYRRHGDLGAAAEEVWPSQPTSQDRDVGHPILLGEMAEAFAAMAAARATAQRAGIVEALLRRATSVEAKYLLKLMLGDMRIGVKQSLIEEAIAVAAEAEVAEVRHAVMLEADLAAAVERAFAGTLAEARMRLFHPLGFMLASPVETPEEAVARFTEKPVTPPKKPSSRPKSDGAIVARSGEACPEPAEGTPVLADAGEALPAEGTDEAPERNMGVSPPPPVGLDDASLGVSVHAFLEDKYDGMRAQLHCGDPSQPGRVAIYSRNREDITHSFPEIAEAFAGVTEPLILDGELLGWDFAAGSSSGGQALPFSILGQRIGRKRVDDAMRRQIPVVFMAFDLLYQSDELLLQLPLCERRARLESLVARLAAQTTAPLDAAAAQGGLFAALEPAATPLPRLLLSPAKLVESAGEIERAYADARARANEGVMLKAAGSAYQPGRRGLAWVKLKRELATLDVVITGAEFGHGRRAGLLSDYTFAVQGAQGELLNVGRAYSGVTDAEIAELTAWLQAHTLEDFGHFRTVEPLRVLEVAFNNVMRSDRHSSGFALRFPRILRIRDDKPVAEIDTVERVKAIYASQPDKPTDFGPDRPGA